MSGKYSVAAHWAGEFDDDGLQRWARDLRLRLGDNKVSLGLIFVAPRFFETASQLLELVRVHAQIPLLVGCSSSSLIAGEQELEEQPGVVLGLYSLPGAELRACRITQEVLDDSDGPAFWHRKTGISPDQTNGWLTFADPFQLDCEAWLRDWNAAYPQLPTVGGLASGDPGEHSTQVYHNGDVCEDGAIAVSFGGKVQLASVISQGCKPIGETWTITKADKNFIYEIGNRPAYQVLADTFNNLSAQEQQSCRGNLFVGLVINEYLDAFRRGDFLIRNLIGADPQAGVLAVGALPRTGQTIQFQRRDAASATEDITHLLRQTHGALQGKTIYGGCLCSCNGRGHRLFGSPNHDAQHVQQEFGPLGLAGFFCNGEIGPVGEKNFLHGYTASLALFVEKTQSNE